MKHRVAIEALESRIAPAAVLIFTDVDGDVVTVKSTKGTNTDLAAAATLVPTGVGNRLSVLTLGSGFAGTSLTITAKPGPGGGDGFVDVGFINAAGNDLGKISITGDLGRIVACDGTIATGALSAITVQSIGRQGAALAGGSLTSVLTGAVGSVTVKGDIFHASLDVTSPANTLGLKKLTVGGSIHGAGANTGEIRVNNGDIGTVKVTGDLIGGVGSESAWISASRHIQSISIGGSLFDDGSRSAGIDAGGNIQSIKIGRDILGGDSSLSGSISVGAQLGSLILGGSLLGGDGEASGFVFAQAGIKAITIGGDMRGAAGEESGAIEANGPISSVKIRGSVIGGSGDESAYLRSLRFMGPVSIGGSIIGGGGDLSALIYAGSAIVTGNVMTSITVGGSVIGGEGIASGGIGSGGGIAGAVSGVDIGKVVIRGSLIGDGLYSGLVQGNVLKSVTIGGHVCGGSASQSGAIIALTQIGSLAIGGSLVGGTANSTGTIETNALGKLLIQGNVIGGDNAFTGTITLGNAPKGSVTIGGSIYAGASASSASLTANELGSLTIRGNVHGLRTAPVAFHLGASDPTPSTPAIGKITVVGSANFLSILGGYAFDGTLANADASLGPILIQRDFFASDIVAGVARGADSVFGTADDTIGGFGDAAILSRIASVTIKGAVTPDPGAAAHGIVAQTLGIIKIGNGKTIPLDATTQGPITLGGLTIRTDV